MANMAASSQQVVCRIPPVASGPSPEMQEVAVEPVSPDASRRLDQGTIRIRRDALAALAERLETLAIERALLEG